MYDLKLQNLITGQMFVKTITSPYLFEKYLKSIKYSRKIKLISYVKYF